MTPARNFLRELAAQAALALLIGIVVSAVLSGAVLLLA